MKSREKILDLIQKLLRMAKDTSSPNEAAIALNRARKIMDEHQISELEAVDNGVQTGFGEEVSDRAYKSMPIWQQTIAVHIGRLNDTTVSFQLNNNGKSIKFSGFSGDAITSIFMYEYLCETVERLSKGIIGRNAKELFKKGFAQGIKEKINVMLSEREQILITDGRSLVVVKSALVQTKFGQTKSQNTYFNVAKDNVSYEKGIKAGRTTSLNRQMTEQQLALPA